MVYAVWKNTNHVLTPLIMKKKKKGYRCNFNVVTMETIIGLLQNGNEINCN